MSIIVNNVNREEMAALAGEIIAYRAKHGLTQGQFAEIVGVSTPTILAIEKGRGRPTLFTVAKIKIILNGGDEE